MSTRASDSSKFTRWDQDSLRGGIVTHPGIHRNGVAKSAVPRTNRLSLGTQTGSGLRIRWSGVRIPPGAPAPQHVVVEGSRTATSSIHGLLILTGVAQSDSCSWRHSSP